MKEDKTAKQEELKTAMDQLSAEITELSTTIKDAEDAQTAISQAIAVLEDFYKSTGEV